MLTRMRQLRERMPALRQREQTLRAELQAIADQTNDRAAFLRLAETLTAFLAPLRSAAETLNVTERQRIVRLVVKDILVGDSTITIRHSIPVPSGPPQNGGSPPSRPDEAVSRLLCKRPSVFSFFESFFVPVTLPVAGAVGMWESRVFCEIPKEMGEAWCWLSIAPSFPQLCSEFSRASLAQAVIRAHLPACDPATEC